MDLLSRHWFQIVLGYCLVWMAAGLLASAFFDSNVAAIASAIGSLGLGFVCAGLILLDMYVPATRRWLR